MSALLFSDMIMGVASGMGKPERIEWSGVIGAGEYVAVVVFSGNIHIRTWMAE